MTDHLKILVVVAHPDEAEEYAAGTLSLLADRGHHIKVVTITNGDAGHLILRPEELARRRLGEAYDAAKIIGLADYEVWDEHDGQLVDTQPLRQRMLRTIRQWRTDLVITLHDEGSGHNDNRLAGYLVRKVCGLTTLPNTCPSTPPLAEEPVVLRMIDYGCLERHRPDIAVDTTPVIDRKFRACAAHATQFLEFAPAERGFLDQVPDPSDQAAVDDLILNHWREFFETADNARPALQRRYGDKGAEVRYAETFELAPYGRDVTVDQVDKLLNG